MLEDATSGCSWLIPQFTPAEYVRILVCIRSYGQSEYPWYDFRRMFMELGGDTGSIALLPTALEDIIASIHTKRLASLQMTGESFIFASALFARVARKYPKILCPKGAELPFITQNKSPACLCKDRTLRYC